MFNYKSKKIKLLEELLRRTNIELEQLYKEMQVKIKELPTLPEEYVCSECGTASRTRKMKTFKVMSGGSGTVYKAYICELCLKK